jgi:hypothetical protein
VEKHNFYFLFVGLLIFLGAEPFLDGSIKSGALIQLALTAILVIGVVGLSAHRLVFRLGLGLAAIATGAAFAYLVTGSLVVRVLDLIAVVLFLLLAIGVAVRQVVLTPGAVTLNRVVGALCLYLLLGVLWTILFAFVELADPNAFEYARGDSGDPLEQFLYYSFVTLTTLGYGDVTPVHPVARTLAYFEAVLGQLYVAVLVASLVGRYGAEVESGSKA